MSYPCMCGADDCPKCFPQNFRNGRYIDTESGVEPIDDCDYDIDDGFDPNDIALDYIAGNGENYY